MQSVENKVLASIKSKGMGFAFSGKDFLHLGKRASVDWALSNLARSGQIRRLHRGLYDYPRFDKELGGTLSPDFDQVAQALARKSGSRIHASGAWAANLLGLSTQVPATIVYVTDSTSRKYRIGKQVIEFQRVGPKELIGERESTKLVVQALRHLGKDRVGKDVVEHLRRHLSDADKMALPKETRYSSSWLNEIAKQIAEKKDRHDGQGSNP